MEPYEGAEPYIFISYARKDAERAAPLLDALSGAGYRIWYDAGIQAGADWLDALLEKVEQCAVFCPLFSEAFKDSYYCAEETKWAYRKRKTIVPLHLEKMARDGVPRLYELLQGRQDLRLYEFADAAQFVERVGRESAFEPCKVPEWHKVGQIQWRLDADGVLTIAKNKDLRHTIYDIWYGKPFGSIPSYQADPYGGSSAPWMPYRKKILRVAIGDDIDAIGAAAFYGCGNLKDVRISDSVDKIGKYAFSRCESLTNVSIPDGVTAIGVGAFEYCRSLTDMRIPDSVTIIDDAAFNGCAKLANASIPDSVTTVGKGAFQGCENLKNVRIPDSMATIDIAAFASCSGLTNVSVPDSVTRIGYYAFHDCENLKSIEIPAGAEVSEDAFPEHTRVIRRDAAR